MSKIHGSSYIYNLNDLVNDHVVGNVFYRDGKIILSNSGSVFDNLLKDPSDLSSPKYDISYKSQQTIYEKQIVCRIEPGEFNYSTNPTSLVPNVFTYDVDKNNKFTFVDLDLILKYVNYKIKGTYDWFSSFAYTQDDEDWYNYYVNKYFGNKIIDVAVYIAPYVNYLESIYSTFDIDGNNKIFINDLYLLFKYFTNTLTKDIVFQYVDIKSTRKSVDDIVKYLDIMTGKYGYGTIKSEFFNFDYSSSMDKTGSYLAPFITTIGLYCGSDLVAVAKLGTPIKNTGELPLNILVKWDV